jgi:hypothetical protein
MCFINPLTHFLVLVSPFPRPNYWCGKYHAPPAEPPGIDDPPEEGMLEVEEV